jgi:hypothetical protein
MPSLPLPTRSSGYEVTGQHVANAELFNAVLSDIHAWLTELSGTFQTITELEQSTIDQSLAVIAQSVEPQILALLATIAQAQTQIDEIVNTGVAGTNVTIAAYGELLTEATNVQAAVQALVDAIAAALPSVDGNEGKVLKVVEGAPAWGDVISVLYRAYVDRDQLRSIDGPAGTMALVEGLGLFVWVEGSDQPDDDETALATSSGVWLLNAASWDLAFAYWLPEIEAIKNRVALTGEAVCNLSSVASNNSADFTATVPGAAIGDTVVATPPAALMTSLTTTLSFHAWVSSSDTVTIRLVNSSASTAMLNPDVIGPLNAWRVAVFKGVI